MNKLSYRYTNAQQRKDLSNWEWKKSLGKVEWSLFFIGWTIVIGCLFV